jgi:hypothetical protein
VKIFHSVWILALLGSLVPVRLEAGDVFSLTPTFRIEQGWDGNVFLQDVGELADRASWVTSAQVGFRAHWEPSEFFRIEAGYLPRRTDFSEAEDESHFVHPIQLDLRGAAGAWTWGLTNLLLLTDGPHLGPSYTALGGSPAIGGFTVRDRRDATVLKQGLRLQWKQGSWLARVAGCTYFHDFRSELRQEPGYSNYVDRQNLNGGIDVGHQGPGYSVLLVGYRYGEQAQNRLFDAPETYSNRYHRFLAGIEGKAAPCLDLSISAGPTFHNFYDGVSPGFGSRQTRFFSDSTATLRPSRADVLQLGFARFEQVSSSGCGAYEDTVLRASWTHTFGAGWEIRGSYEDHRGDFEASAVRDDRIHTAGLEATWHPAKGWEVTARGALEWSDSAVPDTPAREYTREFVSVGVGMVF